MSNSYMAPRSFAYSGGERVPFMRRGDSDMETAMRQISSDPREVPAYGFAAGTEPNSSGGGFLGAIDKVAGLLAPILERAVAYKRGGFPGYGFPGRENGSRMSGDYFIDYLEQMRKRNETEAERARQERETVRKADMRQQIILEGLKAGKFTYEDALKALESDEFKLGMPVEADRPSPQAPTPPAG